MSGRSRSAGCRSAASGSATSTRRCSGVASGWTSAYRTPKRVDALHLPGVGVTETHPKALIGGVYGSGARFGRTFTVRLPKSAHERDAVISAVAARGVLV